MSNRKRWAIVILFAAAFAWVEAAAVTYLRIHLERVDPYQADPLPISSNLGEIELVREGATLVILFSIGWLAGRDLRTRFSFAALAFGVWDVLYYAFLWLQLGWPRTLMDWDVLFLLPLPWWGPVITPILISSVLIITSTLVTLIDHPKHPIWPTTRAWLLCIPGVILALIVFMQNALQQISLGNEAIRTALPTSFAWPLFGIAILLMTAPIVDLLSQMRGTRTSPTGRA